MAIDSGFIGIGFSLPARPLFFDQFTSWISAGKNAGMSWLGRNINLREDPSLMLEGCRTVISLAYPYSSGRILTTDGLMVSRYSSPDKDDYHLRVKRLCKEIVNLFKQNDGSCSARICIDSAPVLERSMAYAAGIGFIGKNNMLIIPGSGSYFYLAEIFTSMALEIPAVRRMENQCGSCTRCIEACPMAALETPFAIDASRCLSYLTIEYKGQVGSMEGRRMGNCFLGCDRCQEACPFNSIEKSNEILLPSSNEILEMQNEEFIRKFGRTALKRAGLEKIKGNINAIRTSGVRNDRERWV